jgi:hypothetical protein
MGRGKNRMELIAHSQTKKDDIDKAAFFEGERKKFSRIVENATLIGNRIEHRDVDARRGYTAWGEPIRTNGFAPDGRWFGAVPETIVAVDGDKANSLIP